MRALSDRQIVWTPDFQKRGMAICLMQKFAQRCLKRQPTDLSELQSIVWRVLGENGVAPSNLVDPYENSLLPAGFYYGRDGLWLTVDSTTLRSEHGPVLYNAHNADHPWQREWLCRAFAAWADVALYRLRIR